MRWRRVLKRTLLIVVGCMGCAMAMLWWLHLRYPLQMSDEGYATEVLDRNGQLLRVVLNDQGRLRLPTTLEQVDPLYLKMLVMYEDQRFWSHSGLDVQSSARAFTQLIGHRRVISGASTLTMQSARLLNRIPHNWSGKVQQVLRAWQLEWVESKEEILTHYLNLAPFGGNIEGVRAASLLWFGQEPTRLSPAQAALLVAIPQSPNRLRPDLFAQHAQAARQKVLQRAVNAGLINQHDFDRAQLEPLPTIRQALPFLAPHLTERIVANHRGQQRIVTSLDRDLQSRLEVLAQQQLLHLSTESNVSIVVQHQVTGEVLAWIGSARYRDDRRGGQQDLARAMRSPGSLLKPFIYGMAFEEHWLSAETKMQDAPMRWGDFAPTNFMRSYVGEVSVRQALARSLNTTAVQVLQRVGVMRLRYRLEQAGAQITSGGQELGLALALGGVAMRLDQLLPLYTALAGDGRVKTLCWIKSPQQGHGVCANPSSQYTSLLTPTAAFMVRDILLDTSPPTGRNQHRYLSDRKGIAHKTGTSYGFRDAWAIGFNARYTVGVWLGTPNGTPNPGMYGANTAAPLLWQVFDQLPTVPLSRIPPNGIEAIPAYAALPPAMQYFNLRAPLLAIAQAPQILFPVADSSLLLQKDKYRPQQWMPIPLKIKYGTPPYQIYINGKQVYAATDGHQINWIPTTLGAVHISVIDRLGASAQTDIWLTH